MTTLKTYLDLVPSANRDKPKFIANLTAVLEPLLKTAAVLESMPREFDIDHAIGKQLDAVGVRVGLSRNLDKAIEGVYFALGERGVGLGEGVIFRPTDPLEGLVSLDDGTYRLMLKIKVAANNWDGSFEAVQEVLASISTGGTYVFMQDNFDMSVSVGVSGIVPSALFKSLLRQMLGFIRGGAVSIDKVLVTTASGSPIFGLGANNNYIGGVGYGAIAAEY